eukprot:3937215-Rhodomonas_salina.1
MLHRPRGRPPSHVRPAPLAGGRTVPNSQHMWTTGPYKTAAGRLARALTPPPAMPSRRAFTLSLDSKRTFLRRNYPSITLSARASSAHVHIAENLAMQEWTDMVPGPAAARLFYSHPVADYRAVEHSAFGIGEHAVASDKRRLADYRRVVCQKLSVDPATLAGYYHFVMHLQAHLDREQDEALALGLGDPERLYLASARQWGAATRVFDSEMALASIATCPQCREVSVRRRGDAPSCATCAGDGNSALLASNGTFPPARPGIFAYLTEAEESALSPVL